MKKYNVGIIGYGWASTAHIEAINATSLAQVSAVWSSRKLDSAELSKKHGCPVTCYTDLEKMLAEPDIQVVSICSYPYQHTSQAMAAARAGKHMIIEKPLALSWEDCLAIQSAVEGAGVKTCVCFECRFSSQVRTIKAVIDNGLLGRIHFAEVDYYHGVGPWYGQYRWNTKKNAGGSSLLSAGCHAVDAMLHFMGNDVEALSSYSTHSENKDFAAYEYPTSSVTIMKFADGSIGKVASVIDCLQPYYFHIHLVGSEGSMLDNKFYSTKLGGLNRGRWSELSMDMLDSGDVSDHPYQTQFEVFFQAIDDGREMPLTSLTDAMQTHQVIFDADRLSEGNH